MEVYGRCDPCLHEGPGTGGLRREQAPVPCTPAMADGHTLSRELATTQRAGPHEDPLTASSGRPSDEGGGRDEVPGSDQPQSSHVLCGTSGVFVLWCLRVSPKSTSAQQCPACASRQKDHLRTPGGSLSEPLRLTERPVRQRSGLAATEEWRPGRRRAVTQRQREPTQRLELSGRRCHAMATSGPVRGRRWFPHGVGTAYTPCILVGTPRAWLGRLLDGFLRLQRRT